MQIAKKLPLIQKRTSPIHPSSSSSSPASLYCLPQTHLHTSGAAVSWPAQAFPADHTMRKIRNWPMKSIRRNVVLLWIVGIHRLAHLREKEKQIAVTRSVRISVLVISAACAVTLGCLGCGLSVKRHSNGQSDVSGFYTDKELVVHHLQKSSTGVEVHGYILLVHSKPDITGYKN